MTTESTAPAVPEKGRTELDVRAENRITDDTLKGITSMSDALKALQDMGSTPDDFAKTYGTGFRVLDTKDKGQLVGVEFVALEWSFNDGDNGPFVSIALVTADDRKLVLNDGSTGVYEQMVGVTKDRLDRGATPDQAVKGLYVERGLRVSTYKTDKDGKPLTREQLQNSPELAKGVGETFYLAT